MVKFDAEAIKKNLTTAKELPKKKSGGLRHNWKPILDFVVSKGGFMKISEDDINISSALHGLNEEAKRQKLNVSLNTRKIDKKVWLFIDVKQ